MSTEARNKLIVALDTSEESRVKELILMLGERINIFKVGLEQYISSRGKIIDFLHKKGKNVFLDLKFHDIPNTMAAAARRAVAEGVWMFNLHITSQEAMKRVVSAASEEAIKRGIKRPLIIGVTVLTSLNEEDLQALGINILTEKLVLKRAQLAFGSALDGVVSSPQEANLIKEVIGEDFLTICPGVRPTWSVKGDQKRVLTPAMALKNGADYLVIGRPITGAENPGQAADLILSEMEGV